MSNNIQFNSTSAKTFRTTCEKYYVARHTIADLINKRNDQISRYKSMIEDAQADLDAITDGSYKGHRTADAIQADIVDFTKRITDAKADFDSASKEYTKRIESALPLYTDDMHKAAQAAVATFGSSDAISQWRTALASSLVAAGVNDATADNVDRFDFFIAVKANSAKRVYKTGSLISTASKKTATTMFLDGLSEYLVSLEIIKPFAHKYVPVSERNKKSK